MLCIPKVPAGCGKSEGSEHTIQSQFGIRIDISIYRILSNQEIAKKHHAMPDLGLQPP